MLRHLQSSWMAALIGGVLYLVTTFFLIRPADFAGVVNSAEAAPNPAGSGPSWTFRNPEFDQWVREIQQQKAALETRAQQLKDYETRLNTEREEFATVTKSIEQMQADFDKNVLRLKAAEIENIRRQAKLVSAMSPEGAAALLRQMPDDDVVRILYVMKADEASLLLDTMSKLGETDAKRAAALTERMRHTLPPDPKGSA
jgi:flagellar motility protein MotE (MotC chaperone)